MTLKMNEKPSTGSNSALPPAPRPYQCRPTLKGNNLLLLYSSLFSPLRADPCSNQGTVAQVVPLCKYADERGVCYNALNLPRFSFNTNPDQPSHQICSYRQTL